MNETVNIAQQFADGEACLRRGELDRARQHYLSVLQGDPVHADAMYVPSRFDEEQAERIRRATQTGRPLGDDEFVDDLERSLGRRFRPRKPCPKPIRRVESAAAAASG